MPIFSYTGRARGGELATGLMEGDTPDAVAARLLGNGITPIEVAPAKVEGSGDLGQTLQKPRFVRRMLEALRVHPTRAFEVVLYRHR